MTTASAWVGQGISGVGIGRTPEGAPTVVVYAADPGAAAVRDLPATCEGLPVTVVTSGVFTAR